MLLLFWSPKNGKTDLRQFLGVLLLLNRRRPVNGGAANELRAAKKMFCSMDWRRGFLERAGLAYVVMMQVYIGFFGK